jgi:peptidoglycan L-alanyl-D-glutamate endopeptidase CwlK
MSRDLNELSPAVRPLVDRFRDSVSDEGIDMLITCTRRTPQEQAALYASGRTVAGPVLTNAKPGESAHNYGLALDVVPIVNGKPDWNGTHPVWERLGQLGEAAGLEWAGRWVTFQEKPHFQLPNWRDHIPASTLSA